MAETGKSLFRKVEKAIQAIESSPDAASTIAQTAAAVIENFREDLGVRGGRLYERREGGYELTRTFGGVRPTASRRSRSETTSTFSTSRSTRVPRTTTSWLPSASCATPSTRSFGRSASS